MKFEKYKDAEAKLDALLAHSQGGKEDDEGVYHPQFCPLISDDCRTDCVCWDKPRIESHEWPYDATGELHEQHDVWPGRCGNAMFTGHK